MNPTMITVFLATAICHAYALPHPLITDRPPLARQQHYGSEEESASGATSDESIGSLIYEDGGYHSKLTSGPVKGNNQQGDAPQDPSLLCTLVDPFVNSRSICRYGIRATPQSPPYIVQDSPHSRDGVSTQADDLEDDEVEGLGPDVVLRQQQHHHSRIPSQPLFSLLDSNHLQPQQSQPDHRQRLQSHVIPDDQADSRIDVFPLPPSPYLHGSVNSNDETKILRSKTMIIVPERACPPGKRRDVRGYCRTIIRFQPYTNASPARGGPVRYYYRRLVAVPTLHFIIP